MNTRRTSNDRASGALRFLLVAVVLSGCGGPILRPQSPEARIDMPPMPDVRYVSQYTHPFGMNYVKIEAVSLVTGLDGTGSDPPPTPQRAALLDEMKRRDVADPNDVLASPNTSMVLVRAFLRPGIQEGDRFDVEVRVPSQSETKSIRNGWLLSTRLTEVALLGDAIHEGHVLGIAEGPVLVDPTADPKKDPALVTRGRILGGGVALKSRSLGLVINHDHESIRMSQDIAHAINRRFYTFVRGRKQGVATPKTADYIEVVVHPRYKDNVSRYMQVLRNIAIDESPTALQARLVFLEQQLGDPLTSASAAIRLEAVGDDQAKAILKRGLATKDLEARFYAAEALAYLDETSATSVLGKVARDEPAFRVNALAALSAMDDAAAYDALRLLLEVKSAETRYGAFRALWAMNANDPLLHDENLNSQFHYHVLDIPGPDMVHVTKSHLPEIVLFGKDQKLQLPLMLDAGKDILVNGLKGDQITVSHFTAGAKPKQKVVPPRVDDVIRAIVAVGGTYPDVVQALQQAKADGVLLSRFEVDALPQGGRRYDPTVDGSKPPVASQDQPIEVATPLPELFARPH
ncbi:MAG TPA: flagellar basal body P-ring protein FlgI [Lacipirellulaceae bacterium]|nr:flagellar basal body P-ring protein FlgI [Lacipirellulaceae bacterium]